METATATTHPPLDTTKQQPTSRPHNMEEQNAHCHPEREQELF